MIRYTVEISESLNEIYTLASEYTHTTVENLLRSALEDYVHNIAQTELVS